MKIKNYTTSINAEKTIMEIEKILAEFGASHIMKNYENAVVVGIAFILDRQNYMLPANVEGVRKTAFKSMSNIDRAREQAYRTCWRLIKDWIHSQLSLIVSGQAEIKEVLLPYMWDGKTTLFQAYKSGQLQLEHRET